MHSPIPWSISADCMSSSSPHGKMSHLVLVASAASMVINAMAVSAKPWVGWDGGEGED